MFAQLTSRTNALRLFVAAAVFMILAYVATLFFVPGEGGNTGIYVLPIQATILWPLVVACVLIIISVIVFGIRSRNLIRTGALAVGAVLLIVPIHGLEFTSQLLREHVTSVSAGDHVYQLAQNMFPFCPDTFDAKTYTCYSRTFLYQCDSLGVLCSIKTKDLLVKKDTPLRLQLVGDEIEIIADPNDIVYKMPA